MRCLSHVSLIALTMALAACGTPTNKVYTAVYQCENGRRLDVVFEPGQAVITMEDGSMATLEQKPAASGIWYSNGRYELRGKGKDATWAVGRRVPTKCRAR